MAATECWLLNSELIKTHYSNQIAFIELGSFFVHGFVNLLFTIPDIQLTHYPKHSLQIRFRAKYIHEINLQQMERMIPSVRVSDKHRNRGVEAKWRLSEREFNWCELYAKSSRSLWVRLRNSFIVWYALVLVDPCVHQSCFIEWTKYFFQKHPKHITAALHRYSVSVYYKLIFASRLNIHHIFIESHRLGLYNKYENKTVSAVDE